MFVLCDELCLSWVSLSGYAGWEDVVDGYSLAILFDADGLDFDGGVGCWRFVGWVERFGVLSPGASDEVE